MKNCVVTPSGQAVQEQSPRTSLRPVLRAPLVSTHNLDEASLTFRKIYAETRFSLAPGASFSCDMNIAAVGNIQRISASWSGGLELESSGLTNRFAIGIAKGGLLHGTQHDAPFAIIPGRQGAIFSPNHPIRMCVDSNYQAQTLVFDQALLEQHFLALTGRDAPRSLTFKCHFNCDTSAGLAFYEMISFFHREMDRPDASPLWLTGLRDSVLTGLLVHVEHTASNLLETRPPRAAQSCVRRALEFIAAHAAEPITMADIVAAAGVPERSLRAAFKAQGRAAPMELLRQHRFELARKSLETPNPTTSVARLVAELGLGNPGRFSAEYRKRFGELPSETLERGLVRAGLPRRHPR